MKFSRALMVLLALVAASACSRTGPKPAAEAGGSPAPISEPRKISSVSVVRAAAAPIEVHPGGSAEVVVHVAIQPGYHVNANPPSYPYLKATELEIAPADGFSVGPVTYPKALERKFAFAEKPLSVYEGEIDLKLKLSADAAVPKGARSLPAKLRIQACDEEVCYPPGTLDLVIPVRVE